MPKYLTQSGGSGSERRSFIYLSSKYLLSTYYMPDAVLVADQWKRETQARLFQEGVGCGAARWWRERQNISRPLEKVTFGYYHAVNKIRWSGVSEWIGVLRPICYGPNINQTQSCRAYPEETRTNGVEEKKDWFSPYSIMQVLLLSCFIVGKITWDNAWQRKNFKRRHISS